MQALRFCAVLEPMCIEKRHFTGCWTPRVGKIGARLAMAHRNEAEQRRLLSLGIAFAPFAPRAQTCTTGPSRALGLYRGARIDGRA